MKRIVYSDLTESDLYIDAVYESNGAPNLSGDVLSKLMNVGVMSGFRRVNIRKKKKIAYIVLESTNKHPDWVDFVDYESGMICYYGDNREPGRELHDTKQGGNKILKEIFDSLQRGERDAIPPIFYFESEQGRNRSFRGLLVPGNDRIKPEEFLIAIWRNKKGERYQNYKALFTILDVSHIKREWLDDLLRGEGVSSEYAPDNWIKWIKNGIYCPLCADDSVLNYRTHEQQMPSSDEDIKKLKTIYEYFNDPYDFEECAMAIAQLMDSNIHNMVHTRFFRDGGRDAIGKYKIGTYCDGIDVEFALEAKRYSPQTSVGVEEVSRLISRLRHRQFGILVTTSYVSAQTYQEIREDGHPVVIISGKDIVRILYEAGIKTPIEVEQWLKEKFPKTTTPKAANRSTANGK